MYRRIRRSVCDAATDSDDDACCTSHLHPPRNTSLNSTPAPNISLLRPPCDYNKMPSAAPLAVVAVLLHLAAPISPPAPARC